MKCSRKCWRKEGTTATLVPVRFSMNIFAVFYQHGNSEICHHRHRLAKMWLNLLIFGFVTGRCMFSTFKPKHIKMSAVIFLHFKESIFIIWYEMILSGQAVRFIKINQNTVCSYHVYKLSGCGFESSCSHLNHNNLVKWIKNEQRKIK